MKVKRTLPLILGFLIMLIFVVHIPITHAADGSGYVLLQPLPILSGDVQRPDLPEYLGAIYKLIIGFAGILAVLMIIIAGLEYIFAALPSTKSDAKKRIVGAVGGLLLILLAWIILNTIDPALLKKGV